MHQQRIPGERLTIAHTCLGRAIHDLRDERGLTQQELGSRPRELPLHPRARERPRQPTLRRHPPLAHALDVTVPDLCAHYQRHHDAYPSRPEPVQPELIVVRA